MMFLLFGWSPYVAASNDCAVANQCRHGYRPFSSEASWNSTLAANYQRYRWHLLDPAATWNMAVGPAVMDLKPVAIDTAAWFRENGVHKLDRRLA
jgi:hypothetical protein